MNSSSEYPLSKITAALARIAQCPDFYGAVLATADGLVLASAGGLQGDAAAACAAGLAIDSSASLATIHAAVPEELLIWAGDQVWYQTRLPSTHLLLASARLQAHAGALRLAVLREVEELQNALTQL